MSKQKPRLQVNDLNGLPQVIPAADPRSLDTYVRPQEQEVMRPIGKNPLEKLADSLVALQPDLKSITQQVTKDYTEAEYADAEKSFFENRDKANEMIKSGAFPAGASPYWQRGLQRASLKQHAGLLAAQLQSDFMGEAGAEARASNDPKVVQSFADKVIAKYSAENLQANGKSLYSSLDLQDIFHPAVEVAGRSLLSTHANYRVRENEAQYLDQTGASIETLLDEHITNLTPLDDDTKRDTAFKTAGAKINGLFYDHDTGIVKNGLAPSKGNQLIVDSITAKMMKTGNRAYRDVLDNISAGGGSRLSNTQYAQAKLLAAEEHITQQMIQESNHAWQLEQRPFQRAALLRQPDEWAKQDERWEREQQEWQSKDANRAEGEIFRSLMRRTYEGLNSSDSKRGVKIINDAIRQAEQILPEKAESLRELVKAAHTRRVHAEDDKRVVGQLYLDIMHDPLGFDETRLAKEAAAGNMTVGTMRGAFDDLERKRVNASHPFMRQPEIQEMITQVRQGAIQNPGDEYTAQGQMRASEAMSSFRNRAATWIAKNPQGGMAEFTEYMREQQGPILERVNKEYGAEVAAERKKLADDQRTKGQMVVDRTKQALEQQQAQLKKQADEKKRQEELNDFKPSGKKTKEGRPILQNSKGDVMTERTITIRGVAEINNGGITNIPTVFNGRVVSDEEAIRIIAASKGVDPETGRKLRRHWSISDAEIAARERSARLGKEYTSAK